MLEHGRVREGNQPDTWVKVWCRLDPGAEETLERVAGFAANFRSEGAEFVFLVRYSPHFKADDWIRHGSNTLVIDKIETFDRKRWQRLHCKRDAVTNLK